MESTVIQSVDIVNDGIHMRASGVPENLDIREQIVACLEATGIESSDEITPHVAIELLGDMAVHAFTLGAMTRDEQRLKGRHGGSNE